MVADGDGSKNGGEIPKIPDGGAGPDCVDLEILLRERPDPDGRQQLLLRAQFDDRVRHVLFAGQSARSQDRPVPDDCEVATEMFPGLYPDARRLLLPQQVWSARTEKPAGRDRAEPSVIPVPGHSGLRSRHAQGPEQRMCVADQPPAGAARRTGWSTAGAVLRARSWRGTMRTDAPKPTCGPDQILRGNTCVDIIRRPISPPLIRRPIPPPLIRRPPPLVRRPFAPPMMRRFER